MLRIFSGRHEWRVLHWDATLKRFDTSMITAILSASPVHQQPDESVPRWRIGRRGFRCQWPRSKFESFQVPFLVKHVVNEARIVNRIRTDRGTLNYLHDYSGVVGGFLRVLVFRDGWKKFCNKYSYNFTGWYFHTTVLIHKKPHERSCASLRCFFL